MIELLAFKLSDTGGADPNLLAVVGQWAIAFLSVPAVAAALTAAIRVVLPSARLRARLTRDLAIYEKLPASSARDAFGEYIESTLRDLLARSAPKLTAQRRALISRIVTIAVGIAIIGLGIALIYFGSQTDLGGTIISTAVSGLLGALSLVIAINASRRKTATDLREEAWANIATTLGEARAAERADVLAQRERADRAESRLEATEALLRANNIELPTVDGDS